MDRKALIIYHRVDLDGQGSGYLTYKYLVHEKLYEPKDIDFLGLNYNEFDGDEISKKISEYDEIYIVDFSIYLSEKYNYKNVTVIDHHNWSDDLFKLYDKLGVKYFHQKRYAAIELCYFYFYYDEYDDAMPLWIKLLGMYDSWRNNDKRKWETRIMPFQMFMRSDDYSLSANIYKWEFIDKNWKNGLNYWIKIGERLWKYDKQIRKETIENFGYECEFEGLRCIICNSSLRGSQLFESIYDENKYDVMIVYCYNPKAKQYIYSIYSTKPEVDCSKIAKKYGEGGHKGAAGFHYKDNLFKL